MADEAHYHYEIYITERGTVQIDNDVKIKVLHALQKNNLSLTELSKIVGKAQSTLSVHLESMVNDGLIAVHDDLKDSRKKYYTLTSLQFAIGKPTSQESRDMMYKKLIDVAHDPKMMHDSMAMMMVMGLDSMGLDLEPIMYVLGYIHGSAMGGSLKGDNLEETIDNVRKYISGCAVETTLFSSNPLTLVLKVRTSLTEGFSKALSKYVVGFFSRILEDDTGNQYELEKFEIFGPEHDYLRFTLVPTSNYIDIKSKFKDD